MNLDDLFLEMAASTSRPVRFDLSRPVVLFGAGWLGRVVLKRLRESGIWPSLFLDNDFHLWNTEVEGLKVVSPDKARPGDQIIVTVFQSASVRKQLDAMGLKYRHFQEVCRLFPESFNDLGCFQEDLLYARGQIQQLYTSLADPESRKLLVEQLRWRFWLDDREMSKPLPISEIYFPADLIKPMPGGEVFVDCGAFDGDTLRSAFEQWPIRMAYAFEPDPENFKKLTKAFIFDGKVKANQSAVAARAGWACFSSSGSPSSKLGKGEKVYCTTLDSAKFQEHPTFIKMDIEGAELDALEGGKFLIAEQRPVLSVCLYHHNTHLWRIPNLIREICPTYDLYIRRYAEENWELICYAVPKERCL